VNAFDIGREAVHVWRVMLDEASAGADLAILSPEERERASRLRTPLLQRRFVAARATLRSLLSLYLGKDPSTLSFAYGPNGKPAIAPPVPIRFSVSHCRQLALVAIGSGCEMGVDVEELVAIRDAEALARRFFSPAEAAAIDSMDPARRSAAFLGVWVRKEAVVKALGAGLSYPLREFEVPIGAADPSVVRTEHRLDGASRHWHVRDVPVGAGYVAALAVSVAPRSVCVRDWPTGARLM